jgi:1-acyl-sn-glycerol-3-phosphate acyltransferase
MLLPRWVRRVTIAPAVVLLTGLLVLYSPLILVVMLALSPVIPGRWRPLRFAWFALLYLVIEAGLLIVLFGLWVATGFGWRVTAPWSQRVHYALLGWALRVLESEAARVLNVRIVSTGADPDAFRDTPLLVLARHAGAGDSFLIADLLINWYAREPRIVLKALLQWDPAIDVVLNRLPTVFVDTKPGVDRLALVSALAANLDGNDAFTIFPEGGNFTPGRRSGRIDWLRRHGRTRFAAQAEDLRNVLAPRQAGTAAALAAAPEADVAIVAHTGLEHLTSIKALWRYLPMDTEIRVHWWRIPAAEAPRHPDEVGDWLFGWWGLVDDWIQANRPEIVTQAIEDPTTRTEPIAP